MSYADATLDLSSVPVACLSGLNGAGKSALLDAVTWALWESARSGSDELMRLGEKEMWVDLTFLHEGERYRVRRARQKVSAKAGTKSSSKGSLEFQIFNTREPALATSGSAGGAQANAAAGDTSANYITRPDNGDAAFDGSWRSLTAANMKETQKAIDNLLRMDFETFINSAYLRQGRADEFTTRAPAERKQILSEILGLSYFDHLQEKAKERARALKAQAELIATSLNNLPELEAKLLEAQAQLSQGQQDLAEIARVIEQMESDSQRLKERMATLSLAKERLENGAERASALKLDILNLAGQDEELTQRLERLDTVLLQSPEIEAATAQFQDFKQRVEIFDNDAFLLQELNIKKSEYQTELARIRSRLEVELDLIRKSTSELTEKRIKFEHDTRDQEKIAVSHTQYKGLLNREIELSKQQETFTQLTNRANELLNLVTECRIRLEADCSQKQAALAEVEIILQSKENLELEESALETKTQSLDRLEAEFQHVEEKGLKIKSILEGKQHKIENLRLREREKISKIEELETHADSGICPLCAAPIVDRAAVIDRYRRENQSIEEEIADLENEIAQLESERISLRQQYLEIRNQLDSRKNLDKQIGQFHEKLSAIERATENRQKLINDIQILEQKLASENYAQVERESLIAVKAEIHKLDFDPLFYSNLQAQIRTQRHIEVKHQQVQRDLLELKRINESLPALQEKAAALADQIAAESYGRTERASLQQIQEQIANLHYDRNEHLQLKEKLADLLPKTELHRDLQKAMVEQPELMKTKATCQKMLGDKRFELRKIETEREALTRDLNELPALLEQLAEISPALSERQKAKEELGKQVAVLAAQGKTLADDLAALADQRRELQIAASQVDDYQFLAEAFGKKGIQAVIIENAIPEIEMEANRILSRLTENKMHIALITQHKTKSGNLVETLELLIADEIGTRSYELFSGGEAFKVNFAVRVALARLLARRAGAKLETLIIDEGFGSQDDASRERLVRAIRSIQSDFARILVITHMADIRDMFPVQIQVSKENGRSKLQIVY